MSIARTSAEEYVKEKLERFKGKKIEELVEAVMKEHNYIKKCKQEIERLNDQIEEIEMTPCEDFINSDDYRRE